ncbi:MAG: hypothetical protein K2K02_05670, partial [Ruminococcus sp.]|nr:hypothetical protein [Ruminococcus sp.]
LCKLTKIMRQNDTDFYKALDDCKESRTKCIDYFNTLCTKEIQPKAIWLCGNNKTAEKRNQEEIDLIDSPHFESKAVYSGECTGKDGTYRNGSLGTISETAKVYKYKFSKYRYTHKKEVPALDRNDKPKVKRENRLEKEEIGYVTQFPMKLGYAALYINRRDKHMMR